MKSSEYDFFLLNSRSIYDQIKRDRFFQKKCFSMILILQATRKLARFFIKAVRLLGEQK